jgi:hypothetical protein
MLRVLAPRHVSGVLPLAIRNVPETRILCDGLSSRWYHPRTPDGRVDRSRPKKPNRPYADIGDAFAYLFGWLKPGAVVDLADLKPLKVNHAFSVMDYENRSRSRR